MPKFQKRFFRINSIFISISGFLIVFAVCHYQNNTKFVVSPISIQLVCETFISNADIDFVIYLPHMIISGQYRFRYCGYEDVVSSCLVILYEKRELVGTPPESCNYSVEDSPLLSREVRAVVIFRKFVTVRMCYTSRCLSEG